MGTYMKQKVKKICCKLRKNFMINICIKEEILCFSCNVSWGLTAVTVLSNSFSDVSSSSQLFCQLTMPSKGGVNGFFFIWKSLNKTSLKVNIDQTNRYHCQQNPPTDNCENTCDMFLPCPS